MSPRSFHTSCYHPKSGKVYVFGGLSPTTYGDKNDLWSFDLARRCWERVDVRSTRNPVPKSHCSLVAWGDDLVLVGGLHKVPYPNEPWRSPAHLSTREIHRFDTSTNEWIEMWSDSQAPGGIFCHSSVVFQHFLIVIGGRTEVKGPAFGSPVATHLTVVRVFDLKLRAWHCILLVPASVSCIVEGKVKWTGHLLYFDPDDLTKEWRREIIPIDIDLFNSRRFQSLNQLGVVQVNNTARLLHLIRSKREGGVAGESQMVRRMEAFHATVRTALRDHIKSPEDIARFYDTLCTEPFRIKDGLNEYILSPGESGQPSDVQVTVEPPLHPNGTQLTPAEVHLNITFIQCSFKPENLRSEGWSVCKDAIDLQSREKETDLIVADLGRVEEEKQIRWTLCEMRGEAPSDIEYYSFVSAGGQMVLHGGNYFWEGIWEYRGGLPRDVDCSSGTFILNPIPS